MKATYRAAFLILAGLATIVSFVERAPLPEEALANRLVRNQDSWKMTFSAFDSRFDPLQTKPLLIKYMEGKRRPMSTEDIVSLCSGIAALFCLVGWIRERALEKSGRIRRGH